MGRCEVLKSAYTYASCLIEAGLKMCTDNRLDGENFFKPKT